MDLPISYKLSNLVGLAASKVGENPKKADALIVPYGRGKFYLATRQSKVAALLPNFLNRMLKLSLPPQHRKSLMALNDFKEMVSHQFGVSGRAALDTSKLNSLSLRNVKDVLGKAHILSSQFNGGAMPEDVHKRPADVSREIYQEIKQEFQTYKSAENLKKGPLDVFNNAVYESHLAKTLQKHNTKEHWGEVKPYLDVSGNRSLSVNQRALMNTKVTQMLARAKISNIPMGKSLYKAIAEIASNQVRGKAQRQNPLPNQRHQKLLETAASLVKSLPTIDEMNSGR